MRDITCRLLGPDDGRVLDAVNDDVFDNTPIPALVREFLGRDENLIAVAIHAGVVVGMASGVMYIHPDKARQLFINEVGVASEYHRRGIARELCRMLLEAARAKGCTSAWVATEEGNAVARAFYESLGAHEDADKAIVYNLALDPVQEGGSA